jgi:hypothetical protein
MFRAPGRNAVTADLVELQGEIGSLDRLSLSLESSVTAEGLRAICEIELSDFKTVESPRSFGRS